MRALDKRLRKLEVGLLPPAQARQTEASLRYYDVVLTIARNRARMRGEPLPDAVPGLEWTHQLSTIGEIIRASRQRARLRNAAMRADQGAVEA